jgi:hypothetical protein
MGRVGWDEYLLSCYRLCLGLECFVGSCYRLCLELNLLFLGGSKLRLESKNSIHWWIESAVGKQRTQLHYSSYRYARTFDHSRRKEASAEMTLWDIFNSVQQERQ